MKKTKLFGLALIAAMMGTNFSACSNETEEVLAQESEIRLTSEITPSRVTSDLQSTSIVANRKVGVTIEDGKSEHNNVPWTAQADGTLKNTYKPIYWGSKDNIKITAYHPYNETWVENGSYEFSVKTEQNLDLYYLDSDLLFVKATDVSRPTGTDPISLKFDHKLAKINVKLVNSESLNNPQVYICGTNITTNLDLATGNLSDADEPNIKEIYAGMGENTSAIIIPQEVSGKFIKVVNGDKVYYYSLTEPKKIMSGNKYEFNLTIKNSILITLKESINEWTGSDENNETGNAEEDIVLTKSVTVEEAGTLSTLIPINEQNTITSLTISGNLNGTDIKFLRSLADNSDNTKYLYDLDLSNATIVSGGTSYDGENNTKDNIIGRRMFSGLKLESLALPNNITTIENSAVYECYNLKNIIIPNSVKRLESGAFYNCAISSVVIPENLTYINGTTFPGCGLLESIVVDEKNSEYDSRDNCNAIIETKTNTLISGCKNTIIPDNIIKIGGGAFGCLHTLTSITIPNSVETIGQGAFEETGLTSITLPNSVEEIEEYAFSNCQSLETVICECETPPTLGNYAFSSNLKTIYVPATAVDDYKSASGWSSFASIIVAKE